MQQDSNSEKQTRYRSFMRTGGLAAWSIRHPVGVVMLTLAIVVIGVFSYGRLSVDLLPHIIYPEIRIRILDSGVPAKIMEDKVTRQLEEQLAITEDAVSVQSRTTEGQSNVDLSFQYGKDIDIALRDASTRLDRAKRFFPDSIEPAIIYKRDPSQIPIAEFVVSSGLRDSVEMRTWVDDVFAKWFLNLPGVAAVEVGGGMVREIQVLPDQRRLAGLQLSVQDIVEALEQGNIEEPAGRIKLAERELPSRTAARFTRVEDIAELPIALKDGSFVRLKDLAVVKDTHEDERLRVRLDQVPGVKVSLQKQPNANTSAVVDIVMNRMQILKRDGIIPDDIEINVVSDQSVYVRSALKNAALAGSMGAILAMLIVYLFLGNIRRTLIIGSSIPIAVVVTFLMMDLGGLTLNIMTLGGLAVGIGMLVDSTIVMLENIYRHQREGETPFEAGTHAAAEVNSAIVASTSTNLAAIIPFLFISGLIGLLFREMIFTISAAIIASMIVALTLIPALGVRVKPQKTSKARSIIDATIIKLQSAYAALVGHLLSKKTWMLTLVLLLIAGFYFSLSLFQPPKVFLPKMDDGRITIRIATDPGGTIDRTDEVVRKLEKLIRKQAAVDTIFTITGGYIFGRTERAIRSRATVVVQLLPLGQRDISSDNWIKQFNANVSKQKFAGVRVRAYSRGIRGVRLGRADEDISLRVQGQQIETLDLIGDEIVERITGIPGVRNITHSSEETLQELAISIDRDRMAKIGLTAEEIGDAIRIAVNGKIVTDYIEGDRSYDVRVRLPDIDIDNLQRLESLLIARTGEDNTPVYLSDVARIELQQAASQILRDNQQRMIEVTASISGDRPQGEIQKDIDKRLQDMPLPDGYSIYNAGISKTLQEGRQVTQLLLGLALFLVFVVMAVQYESLLNPVIILISVPFASIGVAIGLNISGLPLSMPVWLGMIMLAGIVVNNAIVLVEYIEIQREEGDSIRDAVINAARLRLRPILMTTLTTMIGLLPLALAIGDGAEMLQPLAVTIVSGLGFSVLVSLLLVPVMYQTLHSFKKLPDSQ